MQIVSCIGSGRLGTQKPSLQPAGSRSCNPGPSNTADTACSSSLVATGVPLTRFAWKGTCAFCNFSSEKAGKRKTVAQGQPGTSVARTCEIAHAAPSCAVYVSVWERQVTEDSNLDILQQTQHSTL